MCEWHEHLIIRSSARMHGIITKTRRGMLMAKYSAKKDIRHRNNVPASRGRSMSAQSTKVEPMRRLHFGATAPVSSGSSLDGLSGKRCSGGANAAGDDVAEATTAASQESKRRFTAGSAGSS